MVGWGEKGIDGVFEKVGKYYIVEAKYGVSQIAQGPPRQMGDDWIEGNNRLVDAIGDVNLANNLLLTKNYIRVLSEIEPNGKVIFKELDSKGYFLKNIDL